MGPQACSTPPFRFTALLPVVLVLGSMAACISAHASSAIEPAIDAPTLLALEQEAAAAAPRERCFLYSELLHDWTELAGRSMSEGNDAAAAEAIAHADSDAAQLKTALANDSRRLKNAELLLEHTARRLSDMVRVATLDQRDLMQSALKHLNNVHDALLAQIFAH